MTLIVAVNGRESIWLLADRRLSYKGRAPKDDARKIMCLETKDGLAILGYAGLGATPLGTEPADWMSAVLRGWNLPLEQSLHVLAEAMKKQLPRHMARMPGTDAPAHNLIATAFLGDEVRLYTIDIKFTSDRQGFNFRFTRHAGIQAEVTPRIVIGGSGAPYLHRDKRWVRPLLRLVNAYDRGQVSERSVANYLASLNYQVHQRVVDQSVGPTCIVACKNRRSGFHKTGGSNHFYTGEIRDRTSPSLPTISNGVDIDALFGVLLPKAFELMRADKPFNELNRDEVQADFARLPNKPDENLR